MGVPPILGNPHMGSPRLPTEMTAWVIRLKWSLFGLRSETIPLWTDEMCNLSLTQSLRFQRKSLKIWLVLSGFAGNFREWSISHHIRVMSSSHCPSPTHPATLRFIRTSKKLIHLTKVWWYPIDSSISSPIIPLIHPYLSYVELRKSYVGLVLRSPSGWQ
jgi:hypothetical protein